MCVPIFDFCCLLCEVGELECHTRSRYFDMAGVQFRVDGLEYAVCRKCGVRVTNTDQSRRNKRRINDALSQIREEQCNIISRGQK